MYRHQVCSSPAVDCLGFQGLGFRGLGFQGLGLATLNRKTGAKKIGAKAFLRWLSGSNFALGTVLRHPFVLILNTPHPLIPHISTNIFGNYREHVIAGGGGCLVSSTKRLPPFHKRLTLSHGSLLWRLHSEPHLPSRGQQLGVSKNRGAI